MNHCFNNPKQTLPVPKSWQLIQTPYREPQTFQQSNQWSVQEIQKWKTTGREKKATSMKRKAYTLLPGYKKSKVTVLDPFIYVKLSTCFLCCLTTDVTECKWNAITITDRLNYSFGRVVRRKSNKPGISWTATFIFDSMFNIDSNRLYRVLEIYEVKDFKCWGQTYTWSNIARGLSFYSKTQQRTGTTDLALQRGISLWLDQPKIKVCKKVKQKSTLIYSLWSYS